MYKIGDGNVSLTKEVGKFVDGYFGGKLLDAVVETIKNPPTREEREKVEQESWNEIMKPKYGNL